MFRRIQAVLCAAAVFFVLGCNQEVKEIAPQKEDNTPKVSAEERQKALDAEKKRNEDAAKAKQAAEGKTKAGKTK